MASILSFRATKTHEIRIRGRFRRERCLLKLKDSNDRLRRVGSAYNEESPITC